MHNVYMYRILFQLESKSDHFHAVLYNTFNQIVFSVVDSFSETIHHSPNMYIKSIHSALNKHATCTTIFVMYSRVVNKHISCVR